MSLKNIFAGFLIFSFSIIVSAQQTAPDNNQGKQRKLYILEQVIADIPSLKLPENRAFVFAKTGNLMRQTDEKRAMELFQNAVSELIAAQNLAEADKKNAPYRYDLLNSQNLRPTIIGSIASRDAAFALETLYKTRPANVVKALAAYLPNNKGSSTGDSVQGNVYLAQNEINLEQRILSLVADQNPEQTLDILQKSIEKGIGNETLNLLKKLYTNNPAKAQEMLLDITKKLLKLDYKVEDENNSGNIQNFSVALTFLTEFVREYSGDGNPLKFNDGQFRNLADIIISNMLKTENPNLGYLTYQYVPIAEKLFPDRVKPLKEKQKKLSRFQRGGIRSFYPPEVAELLQNNVTPEKLVAEADKYSPNVRSQLYQQAAMKYASQGNFTLAEKVINDNLTDAELENALNNLYWQKSNKAINEGNYNEALNLINQLPENARINPYLQLSDRIYKQNPEENKSYAISILEQARSLIGEKPENSSEMNALLQIISKYAEIEPTEAFRLFEPLVFQINDLTEAAILINSFNNNGQFRQGEMIMTQGNSLGVYLGELDTPLRALAKSDFERTIQIINRFGRRESRIDLKLKLAQMTDLN